MEDLEVVDYSSDRLESSDIWGVPGGGLLEQGVDIPRLGPEDHVSANLGPLNLESVTSPSDFLISPVEQYPVDTQGDSFSYLPNDLLDSPSWQEVRVFPNILGFSLPVFQEGFGPVEGFDQVIIDGRVGQSQQDIGFGGFSPAEDWRLPLGVAEQRGFGSP